MASVPENQVASSHAAAEINALIRAGKDAGASDVHLEPDLPAAYRVSSGLVASKKHMSRDETLAISRLLLSEDQWQAFLKKGSADLARTIEGVRCRFNIFETSRGVGLAIRLLSSIVPTIETTNLHPSLKDLCEIVNGLVLISGSTGSGKSTTVAALVEEINQADHGTSSRWNTRLSSSTSRTSHSSASVKSSGTRPRCSRRLLDSLREDPDVVVVGEMRDPETMRLTLNAAETGHLVFATMHSGAASRPWRGSSRRSRRRSSPRSRPSSAILLGPSFASVCPSTKISASGSRNAKSSARPRA